MRRIRIAVALLAAAPLLACSSFRLAEQRIQFNVAKQRRAVDETCAVLPFRYVPDDPKQESVSEEDLSRWHHLFTDGLDRSNVFAEVVRSPDGSVPDRAHWIVEGEITEFEFRKNWVPTFFPLHLGLSFFTFTAYTLFGGPTTVTDVDFAVNVHLVDARTGDRIGSFREVYSDVSPLNVYSSGLENPYQNPGAVFSGITDALALRMAAALPVSPPAPTAPTASGPGLPQQTP